MSGEEIGKVDELLVDDAETKVRLLRVKHGGFLGIAADHFLVRARSERRAWSPPTT